MEEIKHPLTMKYSPAITIQDPLPKDTDIETQDQDEGVTACSRRIFLEA